ncbi:MAG: hypothetical protein IJ002_01295 [Clostridia bacterium]|nr:hypothetical protein [Clostridia bacterium]
MKKFLLTATALSAMLLLSGCSPMGDKALTMSAAYIATAVLSVIMLIGYCSLIRKKEKWMMLLFASTIVVNIGYLTLSLAPTLSAALMANRISYLGSVFLPLSMLMAIIKVSHIHYKRSLPVLLVCVSIFVFLIAASPGYLDIYYKEVSLQIIDGVTVLKKVYGVLHPIYLVFLLGYFAAIVAVIVYAMRKKLVATNIQAVFLAAAVFVNLCVWMLEQLVKIDFEILSVSYIISEIFLLGLCLMIQEGDKLFSPHFVNEPPQKDPLPKELIEQSRRFIEGLETLTPTEKAIYDLYTEGKGTKDVLAAMGIKENTLKFHNKNLYGKLGVSSRKQLLEIAKWL